jgi:hypothetical protein
LEAECTRLARLKTDIELLNGKRTRPEYRPLVRESALSESLTPVETL